MRSSTPAAMAIERTTLRSLTQQLDPFLICLFKYIFVIQYTFIILLKYFNILNEYN